MSTLTTEPTRAPAANGSSYAVPSSASLRGQIRNALNLEFGFVKASPFANESASVERELLVGDLCSLYQISTDSGFLAPLNTVEIIEAAAAFKRLELLGIRDRKPVVEYCKRRSRDGDMAIHMADPLQRRNILTYTEKLALDQEIMSEVAKLEAYLVNNDTTRLIQWFIDIYHKGDRVPKEISAFLRKFLLNHSPRSDETMRAFAEQLAVLDARLMGPIGWENTRGFLAIIKRFYGHRIEFLEDFLTHNELRDAISFHQHIGNMAAADYFEAVHIKTNPNKVEEAKERIFTASLTKPKVFLAPTNLPKEEAKASAWKGLLKMMPWGKASSA